MNGMLYLPLVKSVYQKINFLISQPKYMLWMLKRTISFEHPKHMVKLMDKNTRDFPRPDLGPNIGAFPIQK